MRNLAFIRLFHRTYFFNMLFPFILYTIIDIKANNSYVYYIERNLDNLINSNKFSEFVNLNVSKDKCLDKEMLFKDQMSSLRRTVFFLITSRIRDAKISWNRSGWEQL